MRTSVRPSPVGLEDQLADGRLVGGVGTHQALDVGGVVLDAHVDHRGGRVVVDDVEADDLGAHRRARRAPAWSRSARPGRWRPRRPISDQQRASPPRRGGAVPLGEEVLRGHSSMVTPTMEPMSQHPQPPARQQHPHRPYDGLRLMHVHAHPDDESSKGAASTARYVDQGAEVHVVTCTGGERGSILNPTHGPPRDPREHHRGAPPGDGAGPRHPRHHPALARLRRLRAGPTATRSRRCPRTASRLAPLEESVEALVRIVREVRPHVLTTYDERGRLPAPRPRALPRGRRRGLRGRRRPRAVPRRGRALAAAEALLPPLLQPPPDGGAARRDAGPRPGVAVGGAAQELDARARVGRADHHQGGVRRLLRRARPGAAGARDPDRPRRALVRDPARAAGRRVADRGLRARGEPCRLDDARGRPLRRHRRARVARCEHAAA